MEGRWKRLLAGGVLLGVMGCGHMRNKTPSAPSSTGEPPLGMVSTKPTEEKRGKEEPIKADTLVAFANVRLQSAMMPDRPAAIHNCSQVS